MTVLGIETSSSICSVGLVDDRGAAAVRTLDAGSVHSEKLPTLISALLKDRKSSLSTVDAIAVSSGPGSFTGLRIGFSAAKGLCLASGKSLVVVSTFEALAASVRRGRPDAGNILVALDAKKGDFYTGRFQVAGNEVIREGGLELRKGGDLAGWIGRADQAVVVTDAERNVRTLWGEGAIDLEDARKHFRGDEIAARGLQKVLKGELADVMGAEPLYLKDFVVPGKPSAA